MTCDVESAIAELQEAEEERHVRQIAAAQQYLDLTSSLKEKVYMITINGEICETTDVRLAVFILTKSGRYYYAAYERAKAIINA
jgi:hypothetical protein